jgi:hypothetical protein
LHIESAFVKHGGELFPGNSILTRIRLLAMEWKIRSAELKLMLRGNRHGINSEAEKCPVSRGHKIS